LPAIVIAAVVVGIQRTMAAVTQRRGRLERAAQGDMTILVTDGAFEMRALHRVSVSGQRLIAKLRAAQITNLGAVARVYLELSGAFSVVRASEPHPGLSLVPRWDEDMRREQRAVQGVMVCARCGRWVPPPGEGRRCEACGATMGEQAVIG